MDVQLVLADDGTIESGTMSLRNAGWMFTGAGEAAGAYVLALFMTLEQHESREVQHLDVRLVDEDFQQVTDPKNGQPLRTTLPIGPLERPAAAPPGAPMSGVVCLPVGPVTTMAPGTGHRWEVRHHGEVLAVTRFWTYDA